MTRGVENIWVEKTRGVSATPVGRKDNVCGSYIGRNDEGSVIYSYDEKGLRVQ